MSVTRWTTESERTAFQQAIFKKGQNELLDALRDSRSVGRIYTPGSIGYDLRYAEAKALPDGGREIILATDRPMSFREMTSRPVSSRVPVHVGAVPHPSGRHRRRQVVRGGAHHR